MEKQAVGLFEEFQLACSAPGVTGANAVAALATALGWAIANEQAHGGVDLTPLAQLWINAGSDLTLKKINNRLKV